MFWCGAGVGVVTRHMRCGASLAQNLTLSTHTRHNTTHSYPYFSTPQNGGEAWQIDNQPIENMKGQYNAVLGRYHGQARTRLPIPSTAPIVFTTTTLITPIYPTQHATGVEGAHDRDGLAHGRLP